MNYSDLIKWMKERGIDYLESESIKLQITSYAIELRIRISGPYERWEQRRIHDLLDPLIISLLKNQYPEFIILHAL